MAHRIATPGRTTRSRAATPLPALQTRQSHAYGAQGKAALQGQVIQSHDAMDEAFTMPQEHQTTPAVRVRRGRKPKTQPHMDEVSAADPDEFATNNLRQTQLEATDMASIIGDEMRPGTALQDSAAYQDPLFPPPPPQTSQRVTRSQQPVAGSNNEHHEPSRLLIFWRTLRKWLLDGNLLVFITAVCAIFIGLVFFFGTIAAWTPLPSNMAVPRDQFFRGIRIAIGMPDRPPEEAEYLWLKLRHSKLYWEDVPDLTNMSVHKMQFIINRNLVARITDLENNTAALDTRMNLAEQTISEMQRILPDSLVVMEENGETIIPPKFWEALLQKMQSPESSPLWDQFLESNQDRITLATRKFVESSLDGYAESHKLVTSEAFQQAIMRSQSHMEEHFSKQLHNFQAHVLNEAKRVAADVVIPKVELEALAYSNILRNIDGQLKDTNYFSIGLGALINPHYTSKTWNTQRVWHSALELASWWSGFFVYTAPRTQYSPATALLDWNEGTQCWCAGHSEDEKAKAQLGVQMPRKIHPGAVVVEHIPSSGTRDIRAAPRQFEVWAQVDSVQEAERIKRELWMNIPKEHGQCENPPRGEKNWVCIKADNYDIHGPNHVQIYYLHTSAQKLLTNKIVFRVTENWGGDHTCIYRVRMTGMEDGLEEEEEEYQFHHDDRSKTYVAGEFGDAPL